MAPSPKGANRGAEGRDTWRLEGTEEGIEPRTVGSPPKKGWKRASQLSPSCLPPGAMSFPLGDRGGRPKKRGLVMGESSIGISDCWIPFLQSSVHFGSWKPGRCRSAIINISSRKGGNLSPGLFPL